MNKYQEAIKWIEDIFDIMGGKFVGDRRKALQELVDRATPYEPTNIESIGDEHIGTCKCKNRVGDTENYCEQCGQALDWSEDE